MDKPLPRTDNRPSGLYNGKTGSRKESGRPRAFQFVREWAGLHREEILANWDRARRSEPLLDIPPLP
jgi:hypothetical protein